MENFLARQPQPWWGLLSFNAILETPPSQYQKRGYGTDFSYHLTFGSLRVQRNFSMDVIHNYAMMTYFCNSNGFETELSAFAEPKKINRQ